MTQTRKNAIALGFFDGIHLGHQALLERAVLRAGQHGMDPAVFTFDRSPREFVRYSRSPHHRCGGAQVYHPIHVSH